MLASVFSGSTAAFFFFKDIFWAFWAFISLTGQLKSRQETEGREGDRHAAQGQRWNQTRGRCDKDKASVYGAPALPTEPLGALTFVHVVPLTAQLGNRCDGLNTAVHIR